MILEILGLREILKARSSPAPLAPPIPLLFFLKCLHQIRTIHSKPAIIPPKPSWQLTYPYPTKQQERTGPFKSGGIPLDRSQEDRFKKVRPKRPNSPGCSVVSSIHRFDLDRDRCRSTGICHEHLQPGV